MTVRSKFISIPSFIFSFSFLCQTLNYNRKNTNFAEQTDRLLKTTLSHGGPLIAVKSTLVSKQLDIVLFECCVACSITLDNLESVLCTLYSPPDDSQYRYEIADSKQTLDYKPQTCPLWGDEPAYN